MLQSNQKIIRHKVGLLNLAEELGNVSKACQVMGLSRDTFYRYRDAVEEGGVEALLEKTRRVPNLKNRTDPETENAVVAYAIEYPAHGQVRVSNELRKRGVFVSPSGVRSIWLRHDLAHFKARLKALEAKVAEEGIILTEAQIQALEKKKLDDEAWGEIDTAHPGYLVLAPEGFLPNTVSSDMKSSRKQPLLFPPCQRRRANRDHGQHLSFR